MDEIKQSHLALRTSHEHKVHIPLQWQLGDKVIVRSSKTLEALKANKADKTLEQVDWYLAIKQHVDNV